MRLLQPLYRLNHVGNLFSHPFLHRRESFKIYSEKRRLNSSVGDDVFVAGNVGHGHVDEDKTIPNHRFIVPTTDCAPPSADFSTRYPRQRLVRVIDLVGLFRTCPVPQTVLDVGHWVRVPSVLNHLGKDEVYFSIPRQELFPGLLV